MSKLRAILGPTNTGKTYTALEVLCQYDTGMIGFPLRLLARENYDRLVEKKGRLKVALITGEEKIIPDNARYYVCTVESMPVSEPVECVIIDEIQLCADPDRGHVFTQRLLGLRGSRETLFLGAETIRPVLSRLCPSAQIETRPRLSTLTYSGEGKINRLKKRSAIVAFSMNDVYELAEHLRNTQGGTAIVLGALSPRTRNAQVDMFQSGEVDYLVATDAIGMGLNMDIDHVALATTRKYDGRKTRKLWPQEIGQIAGRAGRYTRDGTFGVTWRANDLPPDLVEAIEGHRYDPVPHVYWRNSRLEFRSLKALRHSLEVDSGDELLQKGRPSTDLLTFRGLSRLDTVKDIARNPDLVHLLWEVCQIPDFRKTMNEAHSELCADIYRKLAHGPLKDDWIAQHIKRLDNDKGDADTLMSRIAHIRTWTYISNRNHWVKDPRHWQNETKAIEDKLSDALHRALTQRFVDRRAGLIAKARDAGDSLPLHVKNEDVIFDGQCIGTLRGMSFSFLATLALSEKEKKTLLKAVRQGLKPIVMEQLNTMTTDQGRFSLAENGQIFWQADKTNPLPGEAIGRIVKGDRWDTPKSEVTHSALLDNAELATVQQQVQNWLIQHIKTDLAPLFELQGQSDLPAPVAGIGFQLFEAMGVMHRNELNALIAALDTDQRRILRRAGVRMGPMLVFMPELIKPAAVKMRALLWGLVNDKPLPVERPADGRVSVTIDPKTADHALYKTIGYPIFGPRAVRIDMLDRVVTDIYDTAEKGVFTIKNSYAEWLGCGLEELYSVLQSMGHHRLPSAEIAEGDDIPPVQFRLKRGKVADKPQRKNDADKKHKAKQGKKPNKKPAQPKMQMSAAPKTDEADNPFAILKQLQQK